MSNLSTNMWRLTYTMVICLPTIKDVLYSFKIKHNYCLLCKIYLAYKHQHVCVNSNMKNRKT